MPEKKVAKTSQTTKKTVKTQSRFVYAVGRRKTATAQVRLYSGKGETTVNGLPISRYFPGKMAQIAFERPFKVTNTLYKYHASFKVKGSGKNGQLVAVTHALARALDQENKELHHSFLKKNHLLTRDPRKRERRKTGQMGRARKKKQSPKR